MSLLSLGVSTKYPGLIARWPTTEGAGTNAADIISGRDVTLTNGPTWGTGSIVFDGSNDYLTRASVDFGLNGATEFSLSFYLKSTATGGKIFQKQLNSFDGSIDARISTTNTLVFFMHNATMEPSWEYPAPLNGSFHLYTFCFKRNAGTSADAVLYIDKSPVTISNFFANSYSTSFTMQEASSGLFLGAKNGITEYLNGELKDVRLYNRQLSSTEVNNLP